MCDAVVWWCEAFRQYIARKHHIEQFFFALSYLSNRIVVRSFSICFILKNNDSVSGLMKQKKIVYFAKNLNWIHSDRIVCDLFNQFKWNENKRRVSNWIIGFLIKCQRSVWNVDIPCIFCLNSRNKIRKNDEKNGMFFVNVPPRIIDISIWHRTTCGEQLFNENDWDTALSSSFYCKPFYGWQRPFFFLSLCSQLRLTRNYDNPADVGLRIFS